MSDTQTPVVEQKTQPPMNQKGPATHEQKQKRRKLIRRVIALTVAVAIVGGSTFLLKKYVFTGNEDGIGEPIHTTVYRSSIMSKVEGSGTAQSKNSATVSPEAGYQVLELFVSEGDFVEEGQLLYNLDDSTAQEGVLTAQNNLLKAQETVDDYNREIAKLRENVANLTITAPHAGKLIDVNNDIKVGDDLGVGTAVATVVNDTKLRLHLYYSWTYEGMVSVGQQARITLPASMSDYPATVEQVNYVKRVVPEGSVMFEVVFVMDNPGTLTKDMDAIGTILVDGESVVPADTGKLEYSRALIDLQQVKPASLEPYPGPFLEPGLRSRIRLTAWLRSFGRPDKRAYRQAAKVVAGAASAYAEANCAKYFEFQYVWPEAMKRLESDQLLSSALVRSSMLRVQDVEAEMAGAADAAAAGAEAGAAMPAGAPGAALAPGTGAGVAPVIPAPAVPRPSIDAGATTQIRLDLAD